MKIVVLNGSPKGEHSITLQYSHFIQKKFPQHELKTIHVAQRIKRIEKNEETFQEIMEEIRSSDGVLWSFGLWVMAVAAQYTRFGVSIATGSWIILLACAIQIFLCRSFLIGQERACVESYGEEYSKYMIKVSRYFTRL